MIPKNKPNVPKIIKHPSKMTPKSTQSRLQKAGRNQEASQRRPRGALGSFFMISKHFLEAKIHPKVNKKRAKKRLKKRLVFRTLSREISMLLGKLFHIHFEFFRACKRKLCFSGNDALAYTGASFLRVWSIRKLPKIIQKSFKKWTKNSRTKKVSFGSVLGSLGLQNGGQNPEKIDA